jgi:hypothetical protein
VAVSIVLLLACMALPFVREALGLVPLAGGVWALVGAAVALTWAGAEATLRLVRPRGRA